MGADRVLHTISSLAAVDDRFFGPRCFLRELSFTFQFSNSWVRLLIVWFNGCIGLRAPWRWLPPLLSSPQVGR